MMLITEYPQVSLTIIVVLSILLMFLIRPQAHGLILRCAKTLYAQLRLMSRACIHSAQRIRLRNHEVIKALAEALMERQLERRFMRIEKLVEKDLSNYQLLAAEINRQLVAIDEDYSASAIVPEVSPDWVSAVDAIASMQNDERNTEVMGKILDDMHQTIQQHHRDALREHRWTVAARHKVLSGIQPQWRKLTKLLQHIDNNIEVLRLRLRQVDQHMSQFEMLTVGSGQGIMSSILMRFVSALFFVLVGIGAAWINWLLLLQPLDQILVMSLGEGVALSTLAASLHIAMCVMASIMVSEGLRITHFFPLVTAMTRRGRQTIIIAGSSILIALITIEAIALLASPVAVTAAGATGVSQFVLVVLGVVMPLVLSLVVIPLEYLLHTIRPVLGSIVQLLMHVSALALRLFASLTLQSGKLLVHLYDLIIFVPLRLERDWQARKQAEADKSASQEASKEFYGPVNVTELKFGTSSGERRH